jgi:hypothetical protein
MATTTCPECGHEIAFGDWPMCPHGQTRESTARRWDPIIVWASNVEPDKYSFPGQAEESCPDGYHRVEITNLAEADRFVGRMNDIERRKAEELRDLNYQALDEQTRRRRADTLARIAGNPRAEALFRQVKEWRDRRQEAKRARHKNLDPRFHIQVLSFDSGNRNSYSGPETGWRERKK